MQSTSQETSAPSCSEVPAQVDNINVQQGTSTNTEEKDVVTGTPKLPIQSIHKRKYDDMAMEAYTLMKSLQDRKVQDEYQAFGDLVAHKVRKLSTEHARNRVQNMINNILFQAEEGHYDLPTSFNVNSQPCTTFGQTHGHDHTTQF